MRNTTALYAQADQFAHKFNGETDEDGEAKTFMDELFKVFGLDRYTLARFEYPTKRHSSGRKGRADLFWRSKLLIEAKSGHLDKDTDWQNTFDQAFDYVKGLQYADSRPEYILLINFKRLKLYRLDDTPNQQRLKPVLVCDIALLAFADNLHHFAFFLTAQKDLEAQEIKVNQQAAQLIATIHDSIELKQYDTQQAAILLSQILFCLFAEDTGIFQPLQFTRYIAQFEQQPQQLGKVLLQLFEALNTPDKQRKNLDNQLKTFPYINGSLFSTTLTQAPPTTAGVYQSLYDACLYDWSAISPEIFGSLFQAVMNPNERRSLGAHYTSEANILRLLNPLLLSNLKTEFANIRTDKRKVELFRQKLNKLTFLDPACGCGNFLVVTYRELRLLDMQIVEVLQGKQAVIDTALLSNVPLTNFYGYEIDPTSVQIAIIALWLTEHQMNVKFLDSFGVAKPSIPLHDAANILCCNSLHTPWQKNIDYIIGNPPFVGKHLQNPAQKTDMEQIWGKVSSAGVLDYVTCWHLTAAKYVQTRPTTRIAFVSTNSIAQGEQTGILWSELFGTYGIKIQFAHQTFKWTNEAKGIAAVHCVIIGFGKNDVPQKYLFEYDDIKGEPTMRVVKNISPYLIEGSNVLIIARTKPICEITDMMKGSQPTDGGYLLFSDEEKTAFLAKEPQAQKWIKPFISAHEYLNGKNRWCLWLVDAQAFELKAMPEVLKRMEAVRKMRQESKKQATVKWADKPALFTEIRQPKNNYVLIPSHSSENRTYIPFAYLTADYILNNSCFSIPNATLYLFGQITSKMHMAWVKYVCGRLKSDYRYSNTIVYNNYPFPREVSDKKKQAVTIAAQAVLDVRVVEQAKGNTLADLYDPLTMPPALVKAHDALDRAVDKCYRDAPFTTEAKRIEFLFDLYEQYTAGLFVVPKKGKRGSKP